MSKSFTTIAWFAALTLLSGSVQAADWGTLTGRFVYDGKAPTPQAVDTAKDPLCKVKVTDEGLLVDDKGGLANAIIMLRTKNVAVNPEYEKTATADVDFDNKDCHFQPHVAIVRLSQTLLVKNSDPTGHNTNISPLVNPAINPVLAAGGDPLKHKFQAEEALPVKVGCNIHPWMGGWIVVRKDPYAAVSDKTGAFTIKDLPAGPELEFKLWQERSGYLKNATFKGGKADAKGSFKMKLKPGVNDLGDIKVSGSIFKK
jgi:plastocyanin